MKFKAVKLKKNNFSITGEGVLKLIQVDKFDIDLLMREAIQNSGDAILEDKGRGIIDITLSKFNNKALLDILDDSLVGLFNSYGNRDVDFLSFSDRNTTGLIGSYKLNDVEGLKSKDRSLFDLVYDVMATKDEYNKGGSWGIGKTIYYRYGEGICFFYSRTFEDGIYKSKLVGSIIKEDAKVFNEKGSTGIAFLGEQIDEDNECQPFYDENKINEFLSIFNIEPYKNDETGTTFIIPYFKIKNHIDETSPFSWEKDIIEKIKMSIQKWYFPRLKNSSYKGNSIFVRVNNEKVELNDIFQEMQNIYNAEDDSDDVIVRPISLTKNSSNEIIGKFKYRAYTEEELGINVPPENYQMPSIYIGESQAEDKNDQRLYLGYTRRPGMILTYNDYELYKNLNLNEDKIIIGIFVLEDDNTFNGERIGTYFRNCEKANHSKWSDISEYDLGKETPNLCKKKPYLKVKNSIRSILLESFGKDEVVEQTENTRLNEQLAKYFMPPKGYGKKQTAVNKPKSKTTLKKSEFKFDDVKVEYSGNINYKLSCTLDVNERITITFFVKAGSKKYLFRDWCKDSFDLPCKIIKFDVYNVTTKAFKDYGYYNVFRSDGKPNDIEIDYSDSKYTFKTFLKKNDLNIFEKAQLRNTSTEKMKFEISLVFEPINIEYEISLEAKIDKE